MTLLLAWPVGTGIAVMAVVARQMRARELGALMPTLGPLAVAGLDAAALAVGALTLVGMWVVLDFVVRALAWNL